MRRNFFAACQVPKLNVELGPVNHNCKAFRRYLISSEKYPKKCFSFELTFAKGSLVMLVHLGCFNYPYKLNLYLSIYLSIYLSVSISIYLYYI